MASWSLVNTFVVGGIACGIYAAHVVGARRTAKLLCGVAAAYAVFLLLLN